MRVFTVIATVVFADIGGYVAGVLFGKHLMAPAISPKKSWEGLAGSLVFGTAAAVLSVAFLLDKPAWVGVPLGVLLVITGVLGDLVESQVKRDLGIKDMGTCCPATAASWIASTPCCPRRGRLDRTDRAGLTALGRPGCRRRRRAVRRSRARPPAGCRPGLSCINRVGAADVRRLGRGPRSVDTGRVMKQELVFEAPRRALPPRHLADLDGPGASRP